MYTMTGLYSETGDDSSIDVPQYSENSESSGRPTTEPSNHMADTVIKCHSRQPSSGLVDQDKTQHDEIEMSGDCGILGCRPASMQKLARIKVKHIIWNSFYFVCRPRKKYEIYQCLWVSVDNRMTQF